VCSSDLVTERFVEYRCDEECVIVVASIPLMERGG
jgi:hypothetical protein